ncbi:murein hydrolase activator EnvC family protein [Parvibium lacunae]|uniref:Protease n=1 Tax=Parvibium lacunae TaxID=1888893 RepID=A0A368L0I2_9BURK|nr:peptidoglycan DD-metalloendopeptidase family protein [Parvibium lacunae]RCS57071.1 protease [Parvibium lacunae]
MRIPGVLVMARTLALLVAGVGSMSAGLAQPGGASNTTKAAPPTQPLQVQRAQTREQQQALQEKLQTMKQALARSEADRNEVADALAQSERAISTANRKLRQLSQQVARSESALAQTQAEQRVTQARLQTQQQRLAELLKRQYINGSPDQMRSLFNGDNPNRIQRELQYLSYVSKANATEIQAMRGDLLQLQQLAQNIAQQLTELASLREQEETEKQTLLREQATRQRLLAELSHKISAQKREVGALQRDEARLSRLIDNLGKLLAEQAEKERQARLRERQKERDAAREKERQARSPAAVAEKADKGSDKGSDKARDKTASNSEPSRHRQLAAETPSGPSSGPVYDAVAEGGGIDFEQLKGRLKLPVRGELIGRFGTARSQIGSQGGTTWKGLFIRTPAGADIRAIANGRVVFAEWLRGFGNLLIIDHGNQYLSIYGNNESLYKQPGERVKGGETIASAGNSGGNPETGLYFELRHRGQPFDPMKWAASRAP